MWNSQARRYPLQQHQLKPPHDSREYPLKSPSHWINT
jgi:hypothetical protein